MTIHNFFATSVYDQKLIKAAAKRNALHLQIMRELDDLLALDKGGRIWSKENYSKGYTSYASANNLHLSSSTFGILEKLINPHVRLFAKSLGFNLGGRKLAMSTCWINFMRPGCQHSLHLHPLSIISGTYYVQTPTGASAIRFEDPRLDRFMASPPRKNYLEEVKAQSGKLVLFESWLRHDVSANQSKKPRVSISFNYEWK
jgi:uncharacterized protein (TIGR02466 family)